MNLSVATKALKKMCVSVARQQTIERDREIEQLSDMKEAGIICNSGEFNCMSKLKGSLKSRN